MRNSLVLTVSFALASITLAVPAMAQDTHAASQAAGAGHCTNSVTGRDQTLCFEGETVSGGVVGPDGQGVRALRPQHGGNLLPLRAHFLPEMLHSVENL